MEGGPVCDFPAETHFLPTLPYGGNARFAPPLSSTFFLISRKVLNPPPLNASRLMLPPSQCHPLRINESSKATAAEAGPSQKPLLHPPTARVASSIRDFQQGIPRSCAKPRHKIQSADRCGVKGSDRANHAPPQPRRCAKGSANLCARNFTLCARLLRNAGQLAAGHSPSKRFLTC